MILFIAWLVFIVLAGVSALHFLWASGSTWPVKDPKQFARTVAGVDSGKASPGMGLTALVALLILAAAVLPLWVINVISLPLPEWCRLTSMWVLFAVFFLRGLSSYALPNLPRTQPFKSLDRHYFAPLCLMLAAGYLSIVLNL
ncbi:DUF3995 domain-containing protein [Neptunomonas japonica]|uniref:DUF3995 domain-containing protein n=1 Tax=Neptunomonas japonica TaxID=417574 RepID=UPI0003FA83BE|nr:DUF3995 domain-containing protein [Neptunomonas japonica]